MYLRSSYQEATANTGDLASPKLSCRRDTTWLSRTFENLRRCWRFFISHPKLCESGPKLLSDRNEKNSVKAMISPIRKVEDFKRIHFEILTDLLFALSLRLRTCCLCRRKPNLRKPSFHCTSYIFRKLSRLTNFYSSYVSDFILTTSCYNMKAKLEYKLIRTYTQTHPFCSIHTPLWQQQQTTCNGVLYLWRGRPLRFIHSLDTT